MFLERHTCRIDFAAACLSIEIIPSPPRGIGRGHFASADEAASWALSCWRCATQWLRGTRSMSNLRNRGVRDPTYIAPPPSRCPADTPLWTTVSGKISTPLHFYWAVEHDARAAGYRTRNPGIVFLELGTPMHRPGKLAHGIFTNIAIRRNARTAGIYVVKRPSFQSGEGRRPAAARVR